MTTEPRRSCVLDPTCGSGTTAYVAEQWGRRWITIDTSRVALALARARIMGARYPYYLLADSRNGQMKEAELSPPRPLRYVHLYGNIRHGFVYERVPHITLRAIANNAEIDVIYEEIPGKAGTLAGAVEPGPGPKLGGVGDSQGSGRPVDWNCRRVVALCCNQPTTRRTFLSCCPTLIAPWTGITGPGLTCPASRGTRGHPRQPNCTRPGGNCASSGSRKSTPPSPPGPTTSTCTTSPIPTTARCAWPVPSPWRAFPPTGCWAWTRTATCWTPLPNRRTATAPATTSAR